MYGSILVWEDLNLVMTHGHPKIGGLCNDFENVMFLV